MNTVTLEEAQDHLARLIENFRPGEVTGTVQSIAPDFDAPLDEFAE